MATTQRALHLTAVGQPLIAVSDRPVPQPGPGELQIKVTVAGINPHDQKMRDWGLMISEELPTAVLTNDVVGKVTLIGKDVTGFNVGDRVVSQSALAKGTLQNGLQEYALTTADFTMKIPGTFTDDDAATLPTNIIAPLVALFDSLKIPAPWTEAAKSFDYGNQSILIIGGGSNCGKFAVQLASLAGFGKIVTVGGNEAELKKMGATDVLDRHGGEDTVLERIQAVVGDDLIYVLDAVNRLEGQPLGIRALSSQKKGHFTRLVPMGAPDESKVTGKKAGYEIVDTHGSSHAHPVLAKPFWSNLPQYMESGKIKPLEYEVKNGMTPENVNAVLDNYRDGKNVKKTHIHIA